MPNVIRVLHPVGQQHACLQQGLSSVHGFQGFTMLILGLGWVKEQGSWQWSKELVALVAAGTSDHAPTPVLIVRIGRPCVKKL